MSIPSIPFPAEPLADAEWTPVDSDKILDGAPETAFKLLHESEDGKLYAGIWECTPGAWKVSYGEDEFCTLVEGTVRLTDANGATLEYTAPASFMIPSGFAGTWEAVTKLRKYFVIYEG